MSRSVRVAIGVLCYVVFLATFLYLVGFVANVSALPVTVDRGPQSPPGTALFVDLIAIALFGAQHSIMARTAFKRRWSAIVPRALERSVYVLAASLMLILLFVLWQPILQPVWAVESGAGRAVLWALFATGWALVLASTFLINHFELFGLSQVWTAQPDGAVAPPRLRTPLFYRLVRHPLYTGFLIAFWATPSMTFGHLILALGFSVYIFVGIHHEERDLVATFGDAYRDYRARVGMVAPLLGRHPR